MPKSSAAISKKSSGARLPTGDPVLGANLKNARRRAKLTLKELAGRCGVSKGLLSQFEKATTMPSVSVLARIAKELDCGVDALLYGPGLLLRQPALPGMALDDRIAALPEVLREFVLLALIRAERAKKHIPAQFLNPPTNENWPQFAAYLEAISRVSREPPDDKETP